MNEHSRHTARSLCQSAIERGTPTAWFELLYATANCASELIPWADLQPNPNLVAWLDESSSLANVNAQPCLKVGCGLGDDSEYLAERGGVVTAFDIAPTAIRWAKQRFPRSNVDYCVADLLQPPARWSGSFQFVLESYTLQVLPPSLRRVAIENVARFLAPGGRLLVICRAREPDEPEGNMPWPITREELTTFCKQGLELEQLDDYLDVEEPPVRRFRASFRRPNGQQSE